MEKVLELLKKSDEWLLGRIHERATLQELESIIRTRLWKTNPMKESNSANK